jgi:hypothetical protein
MNDSPQHPDHNHDRRRHLELALELAAELSEARRRGASHASLTARAHHVGDLSVLALALRD